MNLLVESTKRAFGDNAQRLLDSGSIMPITEHKTPALRGTWKSPTDPSQFKGKSHYGYAVKTGSGSGLTAVDFDGLIIPHEYNTRTQRGFHTWVPYQEGDQNRVNINGSKVDIRGDGGYIIFNSPAHSVVEITLRNRDDFIEWLSPISLHTDTSMFVYLWCGDYVQSEVHPYVRDVERHGYKIDLAWVSAALASQLRSTAPGSRNKAFYISLGQIVALGGSEAQIARIIDAAYEAGLGGQEIHKVMASATRQPMVFAHLEAAQAWARHAEKVVKSPVIDYIVKSVTEQHTQRPLISQKQIHLETGKSRVTVRAHLNRLIAAGHLVEKVNSGRQPNGMKHCNNFILVGPRHTLNVSNREG